MAPRPAPSLQLDKIPELIIPVFQQVQHNTANHKKNVVHLHKLQQQAAKITEASSKGTGGKKLVGEKAFNNAFVEMIDRTLPIKKGVTVADRVVKFVGAFVAHINGKVHEGENAPHEDEDTTASRFVEYLLKHLLKGFEAKDKNVRYRICQIVAEMVSSMGEMSDDLYTALRSALLTRIRDKEAPVRAQVVFALGKLYQGENPEDASEDEQPLLEVLMDVLQYDSSSDVRRAALFCTPPLPETMPAILSRTRDVDTGLRKSLYSHLLNLIPNPRGLTIAQRELIIRNGLGDREESVRVAAGKLVAGWAEAVGGGGKNLKRKEKEKEPTAEGEDDEQGAVKGPGPVEAEKSTNEKCDLVKFLEIFDLLGSSVAEDALKSIFVMRTDMLDAVDMPDNYWDDLTPEKAFLARSFAEYCLSKKDEARLSAQMPVVTLLAFKIQAIYNAYLKRTEEHEFLGEGADANEDDNYEEFRADCEFVLGELFKLADTLDYADEMGRRTMFRLVREMISQPALPDVLIVRCVDIMGKLSPNERDLIRVIVEVVQELRDPGVNVDEEPEDVGGADEETAFGETPSKTRKKLFAAPAELTEEDKEKALVVDLRCLALCIAMLERVNSTFEENSTLEGMLSELILPAVNSKTAALRERGLTCLGLCSLIHRKMAVNSFRLFTQQVEKARGAMQVNSLKIVFDLLMVYPSDYLNITDENGNSLIVDFLLQMLNGEPEVVATACVGISKLMLASMITDERVLKSLVLLYLSPEAANNQELRQCLSYFFPVYCYSSSPNQTRMRHILISTWKVLAEVYQELEEGEEMVSPAQVAGLMADWADPQKAIEVPGREIDEMVHVELATDVLKLLFEDDMEKDNKKVFCQLLGKLYIPDEVDDDKLRTVHLLVTNLKARRPLRDTTSKNAIDRFEKSLTTRFAKQLESLNEEELRKMDEYHELFTFVDNILEIEEEEEPAPKKRSVRSRSKSAAPEESAKGKKKKKRTSTGSKKTTPSDTEEESIQSDTPIEPRRKSIRAAATKKPPPKQKISASDVDEESEQGEEEQSEEEEEEPPKRSRTRTPAKSKPQPKAKSKGRSSKQAEESDDDEVDAPTPRGRSVARTATSRGSSEEERRVEGDLFDEDEDEDDD